MGSGQLSMYCLYFFKGIRTYDLCYAGVMLNRLQNSRIFCERKQRDKYSNERSGASVETFLTRP